MVLSRVSQGAQIFLFVTYTTSAPPNSVLVRYLLNTSDQAPNLLEAWIQPVFVPVLSIQCITERVNQEVLTHPHQLVAEGVRWNIMRKKSNPCLVGQDH